MRKKSWWIMILVLLISVALSSAQEKKSTRTIRIGVTKSVSHPALDADEKGFEKALLDAGLKESVSVVYDRQNARGEIANAQAIAKKFLDAKVDLIHSIATPTSQDQRAWGVAHREGHTAEEVHAVHAHPLEGDLVGLARERALPTNAGPAVATLKDDGAVFDLDRAMAGERPFGENLPSPQGLTVKEWKPAVRRSVSRPGRGRGVGAPFDLACCCAAGNKQAAVSADHKMS